jgi:hypothetical protein
VHGTKAAVKPVPAAVIVTKAHPDPADFDYRARIQEAQELVAKQPVLPGDMARRHGIPVLRVADVNGAALHAALRTHGLLDDERRGALDELRVLFEHVLPDGFVLVCVAVSKRCFLLAARLLPQHGVSNALVDVVHPIAERRDALPGRSADDLDVESMAVFVDGAFTRRLGIHVAERLREARLIRLACAAWHRGLAE